MVNYEHKKANLPIWKENMCKCKPKAFFMHKNILGNCREIEKDRERERPTEGEREKMNNLIRLEDYGSLTY